MNCPKCNTPDYFLGINHNCLNSTCEHFTRSDTEAPKHINTPIFVKGNDNASHIYIVADECEEKYTFVGYTDFGTFHKRTYIQITPQEGDIIWMGAQNNGFDSPTGDEGDGWGIWPCEIPEIE